MIKNNQAIWSPNQIIYEKGSPPDFAYLIISGVVEFYSEKKTLLGNASINEVFGEISCYLNRPHSVTAIAKTNLVVKKIPKEEFLAIIKNAHPVIIGMLRSTFHRLAASNLKSDDYDQEIKKYTLMYEKDIENSEVIKNKIDTIKEKLDKNTEKKDN